MGRIYDGIDGRLATWVGEQPVFFVATAPDDPDGLINCSPKGNRGELVVVDEHRLAYLDQTGSGVETIAHLRTNGRILLMLCAFAGKPRIVRFHGRGHALRPGDDDFAALADRFPGSDGIGVRSIIVVDVERIADSCGYGVPFMAFEGHRPTMDEWSARKGPDGVATYQAEKNAESLDGLPGLDPAQPSLGR